MALGPGGGALERRVLMVSSRALGLLRMARSREVIATIRVAHLHDRKHDDPETGRQPLRQTRAASWE